jgi:hypothetical protein
MVKLVAVLLLVGLVTGCTYEKRLATKGPATPEWVDRSSDRTDEMMSFKGMALMRNILDEGTARDRALADAREQIAASMATQIDSSSVDIVTREGAEHLGEDEADAQYRSRLAAQAQQAVRGARETEYYWEKWKIREGLFSMPYTRYKYYVRVDVPRDLYERLVNELERN